MKQFFLSLLFIFGSMSVFSEADSLSTDTLRSEKLLVGVKETPPFIIKTASGYRGVSIDLWEEIAERLGKEYEYREYDLTGLLSALKKDELDVSINPLTVTSGRARQFDFTQPFYITNLAIATHKRSSNETWEFIKNLFSLKFLKMVGLLFLIILIFGFLTWLFERKGNPEEFGGKGMRGIWQGIWWSAVTMTTVGYGDKSPRTTGGRIVALIWMFTAVIIISGFTAGITSSLTVSSLSTNIEGVKDLQDVRVGSVAGSSSKVYLYDMNISSSDYPDPEAGFRAIQNGEIDAFVYDEPIMQHIIQSQNLSNDIIILPYKFNPQYYGLSLPRGSELLDPVNFILLEKIKEDDWKAILNRYNLELE